MVSPSDETKYLRRPGEGRRNFSMKIVGGNVLARADTSHRVPTGLGVAIGIQDATIVEKDVLAIATVRGSRPPETTETIIVKCCRITIHIGQSNKKG